LNSGIKDLVIVNNNAGNGDYGLAKLLKTGAVRKIICSFPRQSDSWVFDELYHAGKIELELVPQGNLACRIQAAGMGLGAVFTPTGFGTLLAEGKETRHIDGKDYVLEYPIKADFALIKATKAIVGAIWFSINRHVTLDRSWPWLQMSPSLKSQKWLNSVSLILNTLLPQGFLFSMWLLLKQHHLSLRNKENNNELSKTQP
jgi:3-oxoadipate CoA-transferase alpha subunit